jgi:hypothetical protein
MLRLSKRDEAFKEMDKHKGHKLLIEWLLDTHTHCKFVWLVISGWRELRKGISELGAGRHACMCNGGCPTHVTC